MVYFKFFTGNIQTMLGFTAATDNSGSSDYNCNSRMCKVKSPPQHSGFHRWDALPVS